MALAHIAKVAKMKAADQRPQRAADTGVKAACAERPPETSHQSLGFASAENPAGESMDEK